MQAPAEDIAAKPVTEGRCGPYGHELDDEWKDGFHRLYTKNSSITRMATMFTTLIIGLMAGPAVSL